MRRISVARTKADQADEELAYRQARLNDLRKATALEKSSTPRQKSTSGKEVQRLQSEVGLTAIREAMVFSMAGWSYDVTMLNELRSTFPVAGLSYHFLSMLGPIRRMHRPAMRL